MPGDNYLFFNRDNYLVMWPLYTYQYNQKFRTEVTVVVKLQSAARAAANHAAKSLESRILQAPEATTRMGAHRVGIRHGPQRYALLKHA
jgi:hypothetical protein